ncbi:MAG: hypothetical protein H7831_17105 [Magnetococcus sp. WYHC-3]
MNYLYARIECDARFDQNTMERRAFGKLLKKVCTALHDIEWVDSCDYGLGEENAAIRECLSQDALLDSAIDDAKSALETLREEIARAEMSNRKEGEK